MRPDSSRVRVSGPLAAYADDFGEALRRRGYPPERATRHVQLLAQLSRWLEERELDVSDLSEERVAEFLAARRAKGYAENPSLRWVLRLLGFLPAVEVARAAPTAPTPVEAMIEHYRRYLVEERGLAASTVRAYLDVASLFLSRWEGPDGGLNLSQVGAAEVATFALDECRRRNVGSAQALVTGLRSLLRFLFLESRIALPLAQAVPAVSAPKSFLPRGLADEVLAALLASCDTSTPRGSRDLAILIVLSRLGLRAGEVAGLELGDVDWHRAELVVRGKGSRHDRLPLPVDVGEALAAYLMAGRPRAESRALFLRMSAPISAMTGSNVSEIVRRACRRAGVAPAGAHRLRHSAATAMLRAGASLGEVGQVLRQSHVAVTAMYAKVDRVALRALAQPWPGALA